MAAIDHLMQLRRSQDPQTPPDCVARFTCTKHSWRGKYRRILCITPHMLVTQHPDSLAITNTWSFVGEPDVDAVSVGAGDAEDQEFTLSLRQDAKARAASAPRASTEGAACAHLQACPCMRVIVSSGAWWPVLAKAAGLPRLRTHAAAPRGARAAGQVQAHAVLVQAAGGAAVGALPVHGAGRGGRAVRGRHQDPRARPRPPHRHPAAWPAALRSRAPGRAGAAAQRPALTRCRSGHRLDRPPRATLAGACQLPSPVSYSARPPGARRQVALDVRGAQAAQGRLGGVPAARDGLRGGAPGRGGRGPPLQPLPLAFLSTGLLPAARRAAAAKAPRGERVRRAQRAP